jgi:pimeloyl-ACP methyl ester carboxylesterase
MGMPAGFTPKLAFGLRATFSLPLLPNLMMRRAATLEGQRSQYKQMFKTDPDSVPELYFRCRIAGVKRPGVQQTWVTLLRRLTGVRGYRPRIYLGDELQRISQPTLVIWGENDFGPASYVREATARIPHGRLRYLEGVGHFPFLTATDETADAILEFLAEPQPADEQIAHAPSIT